jgi:ATP-dependent DNA helicase RecG
MTPAEARDKLTELALLPTETEWVEFKHNNADPQEIGEYLSALANAAALHRQPRGYIVWGIEDGTHNVVGTSFIPHQKKGAGNEDLEPWLARMLSPRIDCKVHEFNVGESPIVLFEVQAANSTPVAFSGREWVRVGSYKKPLKDYPEKERELWSILSAPMPDWSAQICEGATLSDLDPRALNFARQEFKKNHAKLIDEVSRWDDLTFLNKAKVCKDGKITRTALILLGKPESAHHLTPSHPQLTWILKHQDGMERDYKHFDPPFLLAVDPLLASVRNLTCRVLPGGTLFPVELLQYDDWVLREVLHNAIAHQDYPVSGRINVVEFEDRLVIANMGTFLPGDVEDVIRRDAPFSVVRNPFLAQAMVALQMIDTIGSGIKRIYEVQRKRSFPMPDYDLGRTREVQVRIIGKVIDEKYTRMLMACTDLDLWDVIALDKVQKGKPLSDQEFKSLKSKKLVEGRRPNLFVSAAIAAATETEAEYIKRKAFDKEHYKKMVVAYLETFGEAKREDFDKLLFDKLSNTMNDDQKSNFIKNLLQEMRKDGTVRPIEGKRGMGARWQLSKTITEDSR